MLLVSGLSSQHLHCLSLKMYTLVGEQDSFEGSSRSNVFDMLFLRQTSKQLLEDPRIYI